MNRSRASLRAVGLGLLALACAAVWASPPREPAVSVDTWSVQRRMQGGKAQVISSSWVNPRQPLAPPPSLVPLLQVRSAGSAVQLDASDALASQWRSAGPLLQPELQRAATWLARLQPGDTRGRTLAIALVDRARAYKVDHAHAADDHVTLELLMPVDAAPPSRSAALAQALALGLHESAHALRPLTARDRDDDEYRASLLAACYVIDGLQRGDRARLQVSTPRDGDFTVQHSRQANARAIADLVQVAGAEVIDGGDVATRQRLLGWCTQRLAQPAR